MRVAKVMTGLIALASALLAAGGPAAPQPAAGDGSIAKALVEAAIARTRRLVIYDPTYRVIAYPGGDVALDRGVCSDVIVRSYRALGIDLQRRVHEDMRRAFRRYPRRWGLTRPDRNIDHRRVANLRVFFTRHGQSLPVSRDPSDYQPGDLVTWDLAAPRAGGARRARVIKPARGAMTFARTPHIGVVTHLKSADGKRPLIVHNIGAGTRTEDMLLSFRITGHYRYAPADARLR